MIRGFSDQNKGIDIAGKMGQPVVAAADGKVVYSGNGLRATHLAALRAELGRS